MKFDQGWWQGARHNPSPHCDARPDESPPSLLVLHNISLPPGQFGTEHIDDLFMGRLQANAHPFFADIATLRVSAHFLIRRDGEVVQYVPLHRRAWHAGVSVFQGQARCNDFSIGVELEGTDHCPYDERQYQSLHSLSLDILAQCPRITPGRIVGHNDIAPGRKTDPGASFDWQRYRTRLWPAFNKDPL